MHYLPRCLSAARVGAVAALMAFCAPAALAQGEAVVATIDGEPVTEADLSIAMTDLSEQFAQLPDDQRRAAALSAIIEIRLLAAEAEKAGLAEGDEFARRMPRARWAGRMRLARWKKTKWRILFCGTSATRAIFAMASAMPPPSALSKTANGTGLRDKRQI